MDKESNLNLSFDQPHPQSFSFAGNQQQQIQTQQKVFKNNLNQNLLQVFLKQQQAHLKVHPYDLVQQYIKWNIVPAQKYIQFLNTFLQYFPFNKKYWQEWIVLKRQLFLDHQSTQNQYDCYQKALIKNSKCFQIWEDYIQFLHSKMLENNLIETQNKSLTPVRPSSSPIIKISSATQITPQIFRKQLQKAIVQIGADSRAGKFYKYYYPLLAQGYKYQFYKKIFTRSLSNLQQFYEMFENWLKLECNDEMAQMLYFKENKGSKNHNNSSNLDSSTMQAIKQFLKLQVTKIYQKTINYRQKKKEWDQKIKFQYFEDRFTYQYHQSNSFIDQIANQLKNSKQIDKKIINDHYEAFQNLIIFERQNGGSIQNISYKYQRAIMVHLDQMQIWQDTFYYLQNQTGKYLKVLSILRNNQEFFLSYPSKDLYFYWCDLQQRENPKKAALMYERIHNYYIGNTRVFPITLSGTFEIFMKQVQFQIRGQQLNNAKEIYDQILAHYCSYLSLHTSQTQNCYKMLAHTVVQYCNFVIRFYRDFQYPKKLYKMYFQFLPFNKYLFIEYLQFMKHFQNREGYYDELMSIILLGLSKAKQEMQITRSIQFDQVVKIIKQILRSLLGSIYLIKMSQRKVMEIIQSDLTQQK